MPHVVLALTGSLALSAFHALSLVLARLPVRFQVIWHSVTGGAGLSYVFLYLIYQLATEGAEKMHALLPLGPAPLETMLLLLLGALALTYVVQTAVERTPGRHDDHRWFMGLFVTYSFLAGAGVAEEAVWGGLSLVFYDVAIGLHILSNALFMRHRFPAEHTPVWQATLGAAPLAGCAVALAAGMPEGARYMALAIVAGGTITISFQHELPESGSLQPLAFLFGVVAYAALILGTWRF